MLNNPSLKWPLVGLFLFLSFGLLYASVSIGAIDLDGSGLILFQSRIPRTLAVVLAGASLAVAGTLMQLLVNNKYVEPSTTGTTEWALLGMLVILVLFPEASVWIKLTWATVFAFVGAGSFLWLVKLLPTYQGALVPLVGIMYSGIISSAVYFFAYPMDLLQSLMTWVQGDFSTILKGRYELLWLAAFSTLWVYWLADRFTLVSLGRSFALGVGVRYQFTLILGLLAIAMTTSVTLVTVGILPFLGLVVPNLVSMLVGDNLRKSLPLIAGFGAVLILLADIVARLVIHPYEMPIGLILGIGGSVIFLWLLLKRRN